MIHSVLIKSWFMAEISLLYFFFYTLNKQGRQSCSDFDVLVCGSHMDTCRVAPLTYSFSTKTNMILRWITVQLEKEKQPFYPRAETSKPSPPPGGGGDSTLWQWLRSLTGIVLSHIICFSSDDRGPSVPGPPPWWQEAGAAGSGTGHVLLAPWITNYDACMFYNNLSPFELAYKWSELKSCVLI